MNRENLSSKLVLNNVAELLDQHVTKHPDKVAFIEARSGSAGKEDVSITYKEFLEQATKLAAGFSSLNIRSGSRVIVFIPLSVKLYAVIVALLRLGAVPVFLDSWSRHVQLLAAIRNASPQAIIAPQAAYKMFGTALPANGLLQIATDQAENDQIALTDLMKSSEQNIAPVAKEDMALLTYTTGSSGEPKGVKRTHEFLLAQHSALKRLFPYQDNAIDIPIFPVFALNNIASGITTVIPDIDLGKPSQDDAECLFTQIERTKATTLTLAPNSFRDLSAYCRSTLKKLHGVSRVLTGGAPISENDMAQFCSIAPVAQTWILYGSTEVEPISFAEAKDVINKEVSIKTHSNINELGVYVGDIDPELAFSIIELNPEPIEPGVSLKEIVVSPNQVGELLVTGEQVCKEYFNNEEAIRKIKVTDDEGVVWHRTGDLVRLDKNGGLWVVGRSHNVVSKNGEIFFPVRPEIMMKEMAGVEQGAYISLSQGEVVAVLQLTQDSNIGPETIRSLLTQLFIDAKLPLDRIEILPEIPMDVRHHSKVDYSALRTRLKKDYG